MNYLVATSRGGGLQKRMPKGYIDVDAVLPGRSIDKITRHALSLLPNSHRARSDSHIYILAGLPDVTTRVKSEEPSYRYVESIFVESPDQVIQRVNQEFDKCARDIARAGAVPIFCTVVGCNIEKYNRQLLNSGQTHYLHHSDHYSQWQIEINHVMKEINAHIININRRNGMATPHLHSDITEHRGKKKRYYITKWERLHDGVHGTDATKTLWAKTIARAIEINREKSESDNELNSPKRSWKGEKRQRTE